MINSLSALSYNLKELGSVIINHSDSHLHIDVIDDSYQVDTGFNLRQLKDLRINNEMFIETHLLLKDYTDIEKYIKAGSDLLIIPFEAFNSKEDYYSIIKLIKSYYIKTGLSVFYNTLIESVFDGIDGIDVVDIIFNDFNGDDYYSSCIEKVKKLVDYRSKNNLTFMIEVEGLFSETNIQELEHLGVDIITKH